MDSPIDALAIAYTDIEQAAARLAGIAHRTSVLTSRTFNHLTGAEVFFKAENFQRTGSFKFRGAYNCLSQLSPEERDRGVLAFSSGNHAQGVALAGKLLGIQTAIVMPEDAPQAKLAATRGYGAEVLLRDRAELQRPTLQTELLQSRGNVLVPPFDHPQIIAGQGTAGKELIEETGALDALLVCCGGGGLLSGCALATKALAPQCQVIGVEPEAGDDMTRSFHTKTIQRNATAPQTLCDGARTLQPGQLTLPIILSKVDDLVTVSDVEIIATLRLLYERMKIVVEPTGALAAAALLHRHLGLAGKRVGVILSGGNVDLPRLADWLD